ASVFAAQLRQPASAAGGTKAGAAGPTPRRTPVRLDLVRSAELSGDLRASDIAPSQADAVSILSASNRAGGRPGLSADASVRIDAVGRERASRAAVEMTLPKDVVVAHEREGGRADGKDLGRLEALEVASEYAPSDV